MGMAVSPSGTGIQFTPSVLYSIVSSTPPISPSLASGPLGFFVTVTPFASGASGVPFGLTVSVRGAPGWLSSVPL